MQCLDDYLAAFNGLDDEAYDATFNFPTYRLAAGEVAVQHPGERHMSQFAASNPNWDYSEWSSREVVQSDAGKVHVLATLARYRADGTLVTSFQSLYVITLEDGHWGIKIRSSFAPQ